MGAWRHPFEPAAIAMAPYWAASPGKLGLDDNERQLIRSLRPEARATWIITLSSAAVSIFAYCGLWDVRIAVGLVLGMWAHELGHLVVMRRLKIDSGPILFVPFVGAVQRMGEQPQSELDAARLGLAGPICSMLFACVCRLGHAFTADPALRFLATAHAILAVVDLLPFGRLDGKRVVEALSQRDRIICTAVAGLLALVFQSLLLLPVCLAMCLTIQQPVPERSQPWAAATLAGVFILSLVLV
jgi:Zn-dependent protease